MLPILWAPQNSFARDTAPDGIYLFLVWAILIIMAFLISRSLVTPAEEDDPDPGDDPDDVR